MSITSTTDPQPVQPADDTTMQQSSNPSIPPPSPTSNNAAIEQSNNHHSHSRSILLIASLLVLMVSTFILSVFFFRNERQPQTLSRASSPSPNLQPTTHNSQQSSSSFGSLLNKSGSPDSGQGKLSDSDKPTTPPQSAPQEGGTVTVESMPDSQKASFFININNDSFSPNNLIVYKGQIVSLSFKAQDKNYDISLDKLGLYLLVPAGATKSMDFQAPITGDFNFQCKENCPGGNTKGTLIIK